MPASEEIQRRSKPLGDRRAEIGRDLEVIRRVAASLERRSGRSGLPKNS